MEDILDERRQQLKRDQESELERLKTQHENNLKNIVQKHEETVLITNCNFIFQRIRNGSESVNEVDFF
jgi:hypothetical protein